uniref:CCHC-type domain-containing protein n=1 Tax=Lactuca sativa TaxID=4236 RepID=A0A9R1UEE1_LACSA|nr:hypothetical protein LSAT_V11C900485610 [Lactuca sativa]
MASTSNLSFVPCQIDGNFNLGNTDLINELEKRLSKLHISNTNNINTLTNEESENSDINSETNFETLAQQFDTNDDINQLTNDFSKLNKIHQSKQSTFGKNPKPTIRNYWNRPSLPDVQLEERTFQFDRSQYDGNSVYEWNIDGHSEHQIMNIVQEMTMAANAYKAHNNTQLQIVNIITSGFTGSLKGWWDFYISHEEKDYILSAKKTIIKQENNQQIQTFEDDMVNTLIFAIIKNFVGDPITFQEKTSEILMNLHCRKLTDFRWYKDNYLVKVFSRPDCKESYWKERFIAGLPKLFAERVRQKLRENFNNTIPYQNLTYGDLINYINKEGLAVCADLRFKEKLKKDRINSKNELGNFCQQYGYQPLNGPSTSKSKVFKKRSSKYFRKKKYNLPENYKKGKDYASKSKKPYRLNYKKSKRKSKDIIICHKCGRNDHTANNCYAKTKINELNVSEDLKEQIRKIILNTDSDSDDSISDFQTNDLNILENTTSSSEDSDICECIGKCHCNNLINVITSSSINVLSQDDKDLLNSLDSIKDKNIQELLIKQMLNKTNNITPANNQNFNLKNIYERFTEAKPISMQELQEELKIQIQESINNSEQNLKDSYKTTNQGTNLNNNHIHDVRRFIRASIKIRNKQIRYLKTNLDLLVPEDIPSKSRAIHMNNELESHCKNEIQDLINKKLIRPSKSPWSCSAFYVMNAAELERGSPRLVINYKPLNKVLEWIRYPIPNKRNLLKKLYDSKIFSKFDMKSGFWQIQLHEEDKYKTGHDIVKNTIRPITRSLQFSTKFPDEIKDKKQLQRFLGCLNYIHDFFKDLGIICKPLYNRLKDNPEPWTQKHTDIIKYIKQKVPTLPCLNLPHPDAKIIVETDASDIGFGGILKQKIVNSTEEQLVRYYSGAWNDTQKNYSTVKKEILSIYPIRNL